MTIQTIKNETGAGFTLFDPDGPLQGIGVENNHATYNAPMTINRVNREEVNYTDIIGVFQDGRTYVATFIPEADQPATIRFTENNGDIVDFRFLA